MDKDKFLEGLIAQYREEIEEILVESEHIYRSTIDYEILDMKVAELIQCARVDGIDENIVWDLLHTRIPSYVNFKNSRALKKRVA